MRHLLAALLLGSTIPIHIVAEPCGVASFQAGPLLPLPPGGSVSQILTADFDRDGRPDLLFLMTTGMTGPPTYTWVRWLARPDGTFTETVLPLDPAISSVTIADVDGDGWPDLVALRRGDSGPAAQALQVLRNDHHGGFTALAPFGQRDGLLALPAFGDVTGDGKLDLVTSTQDPATPEHAILLVFPGDGSGGFGAARETAWDTGVDFYDQQIVLADVDGDGKLDAVVGTTFGFHAVGFLDLLRGDGAGFTYAGLFANSCGLTGLATGDFDRDGRADVVWGGQCTLGSGDVGIASGAPAGLPLTSFGLSTGQAPGGFSVADFNADGAADLAFHEYNPSGGLNGPPGFVHVFLATPVGELTGDARLDAYGPFAVADLDGDGRPDIVTVACAASSCGVVIHRNTCADVTSPAATLLVPAAVSLWGAAGTRYETDLTLLNAGAATATIGISQTTYSGAGGGFLQTVTLPAGHVVTLSSSAPEGPARLRLAPEDGGPLRLAVNGVAASDVTATARVTISKVGAPGLAGVAFEARDVGDAFTTTSWIPWLAQDGSDRTNLAVVNAGGDVDGPVTLRVTLTSSDVATPGSTTLPDITLQPGHAFQWNRVLSASGLSAKSGWATIERVSATGRYVAYAVVNDETTSDGSIVEAVPSTAAGNRWQILVPAVVGNDRYLTELVLLNVDASPRRLHLQFFSGGLSRKKPPLTIEVPARAQLRFEDIVVTLRAADALDGLAIGENAAGGLVLSPETIDGTTSGILAVARTRTRDGYGVTYAGQASDFWFTGRGRVAPARQDAGSRTNLTLMLPVQDPNVRASFLVDVIDPNGRRAGRMKVELGSFEWRQKDAVLRDLAPGLMNGWIWVHKGLAVAYGVLNDGGSAGTGTGDGTFLLAR